MKTPTWSPDGRELAFANDDGLWIVSATGGKSRLVARGGGTPRWSPDGRELSFANRDGLWIVSATGGKPRLVVKDSSIGAPAWAPR